MDQDVEEVGAEGAPGVVQDEAVTSSETSMDQPLELRSIMALMLLCGCDFGTPQNIVQDRIFISVTLSVLMASYRCIQSVREWLGARGGNADHQNEDELPEDGDNNDVEEAQSQAEIIWPQKAANDVAVPDESAENDEAEIPRPQKDDDTEDILHGDTFNAEWPQADEADLDEPKEDDVEAAQPPKENVEEGAEAVPANEQGAKDTDVQKEGNDEPQKEAAEDVQPQVERMEAGPSSQDGQGAQPKKDGEETQQLSAPLRKRKAAIALRKLLEQQIGLFKRPIMSQAEIFAEFKRVIHEDIDFESDPPKGRLAVLIERMCMPEYRKGMETEPPLSDDEDEKPLPWTIPEIRLTCPSDDEDTDSSTLVASPPTEAAYAELDEETPCREALADIEEEDEDCADREALAVIDKEQEDIPQPKTDVVPEEVTVAPAKRSRNARRKAAKRQKQAAKREKEAAEHEKEATKDEKEATKYEKKATKDEKEATKDEEDANCENDATKQEKDDTKNPKDATNRVPAPADAPRWIHKKRRNKEKTKNGSHR